MKLCTCIIAILVLTSNPVFGQYSGDRVRITTSGGMMIGTVSEMSGEAYKVKLQGGSLRSVAFSDIRKLERSLGTRSNAKKGFLVGAGIGVLGGIVVAVAIEGAGDEIGVDSGGFGIAAGTIAAAGWGLGLGLAGTAIGYLIKTEKWAVASIPSTTGRLRISPVIDVASLGGDPRVVLGARLRF